MPKLTVFVPELGTGYVGQRLWCDLDTANYLCFKSKVEIVDLAIEMSRRHPGSLVIRYEGALHRLRRRVAEGEISHERIALYVSHDEGFDPLTIDENGTVSPWPAFQNSMDDLVAISEALGKRKP